MSSTKTPAKKNSNYKGEIILAVIALIGVIVTALFTNWDKLFPAQSTVERKVEEYTLVYSGYIRDKNSSKPIVDAEVSFLGLLDIKPKRTDSDGNFYFEIKKPEKQFPTKVLIKHEDYFAWSSYRILTKDSTPEGIFLEPRRGKKNVTTEEKQLKDELEISGYVSDSKGNGLSGVEISIVGIADQVFSTSNGNFFFKVKGEKDTRILLKTYKQGYKSWNDYISIPNQNLSIRLEKDE